MRPWLIEWLRNVLELLLCALLAALIVGIALVAWHGRARLGWGP